MLSFVLMSLSFATNPDVSDETPVVTAESRVGKVAFDCRQPAEVQVDGHTLFKTYVLGSFELEMPLGRHEVMVFTNGKPQSLVIDVNDDVGTRVLVGRTGLSADTMIPDLPDADGLAKVEFRVIGTADMMVQIGRERHRIDAGATHTIDIPLGDHSLMVHNGGGTVVWARGKLFLTRADNTVVQLSEGRMPEVSGEGASFHAR